MVISCGDARALIPRAPEIAINHVDLTEANGLVDFDIFWLTEAYSG